jgi:phosphoglycolate phosphatase-like HAD superfamily hydrolase
MARRSIVPGTSIEIINPAIETGRIRFALFDFDGTISVIREGWQRVMIPFMVEEILKLGTGESREEIAALVEEFVTRLTGKQTIYQMIELAEAIRARGGTPLAPAEYKRMYLDRLWVRICDRVAGLKSGQIDPDDMMIMGARSFLKGLQDRGVTMFLASGTDQEYVVDEAAALKLECFFEDRIFGAVPDYKKVDKKVIIDRILEENHLSGPELVVFGDGYVEIEDGKAAGGIAVGVASNEPARCGLDQWKRNRLIGVGADIIIPDYRDGQKLLELLFAPPQG